MIERDHFKALALQIRDLQDNHKDNLEKVLEHAEDAGVDRAGLRRFVAWKRQDPEKRAQKEAIDRQCQYLAGERDTPAVLPIGCELAQAINCFRRNMTVRQVAGELQISTGKAGKLRQLARMFAVDVHVHADVDNTAEGGRVDVISPPEVADLPLHDPETGEIAEPASPGLPPKHAAAIGAVLDEMAEEDDLVIPSFLRRQPEPTP